MVEIDEKLEISDIHILEENDQLEIIFEEELIESCFFFFFSCLHSESDFLQKQSSRGDL